MRPRKTSICVSPSLRRNRQRNANPPTRTDTGYSRSGKVRLARREPSTSGSTAWKPSGRICDSSHVLSRARDAGEHPKKRTRRENRTGKKQKQPRSLGVPSVSGGRDAMWARQRECILPLDHLSHLPTHHKIESVHHHRVSMTLCLWSIIGPFSCGTAMMPSQPSICPTSCGLVSGSNHARRGPSVHAEHAEHAATRLGQEKRSSEINSKKPCLQTIERGVYVVQQPSIPNQKPDKRELSVRREPELRTMSDIGKNIAKGTALPLRLGSK